jgi:murein DD-endopeptidase MepM/ murein hydrolase activator NlpD
MITRALEGDWPLAQGYGPTDFDGEPAGHGYAHWHEGWDLACPTGTGCLATVNGTVRRTGPGYLVIGDYSGDEHYYFHILTALCGAGQQVSQGQRVALSGQEAVAGGVVPTGPHLHYGVRHAPYGYQVNDFDPTPYLVAEPEPKPHPTPEDDDMPTEVYGPHFPLLGPIDVDHAVTLFNGVNTGQDRVYIRTRNDNPDASGAKAIGTLLLVKDDGSVISSEVFHDPGVDPATTPGLSPSKTFEWQLPPDLIGNLILQSTTEPVSVSVKTGKR